MKTCVSSLMLAAALSAQQTVVVPPANTAVDAPSRTTVVGSDPERMQIVIDAPLLTGLAGHRIDALLLRRDGALSEALSQGTWSVVLRFGSATIGASGVQPDYASNISGSAEVFRGTVVTPASPIPSAVPGWTSPDVVRIDLSAAYTYTGGGLVVDLETVPQGSPWWPVDAIDEPVAGSATSVGTPCGAFAGWPQTAMASADDLVIGRTTRVRLHGQPTAPAFLLIGDSLLAQPLDMSVIGAPGCQLHVLPFAALATTVGAPQFTAEFGGTAWIDLHLPGDVNLLGAALAMQWFEWQSTGLAFSNALSVQISANPPGLGMALVTGQLAGTPMVRSYGIPVLGFVTD